MQYKMRVKVLSNQSCTKTSMVKMIIALVLFSVFITYTHAIPSNEIALQNRQALQLGEILKPILECLMNNLSQLSQEDLSYILEKLKEILSKLGGCLNINVDNATESDILTLIQCLIDKLSQVSKEQLSDIVKQLQPVLIKVQNILNCIKEVLKKFCKGLCDIPGLNICGSSTLGIDLLKIILELLNPLVYLILCKLLG